MLSDITKEFEARLFGTRTGRSKGNMGEMEKEGKMTTKDELVTAIVHVRQSWVETTRSSIIFASANVALERGDILAIPVTRWDISDDYFVGFTFYPRALEKEPVKSIKVLVPKQAVVLIVELKEPEAMRPLGYKKDTSD